MIPLAIRCGGRQTKRKTTTNRSIKKCGMT
ncbi:Uncharacterised protein [Vibrio cholerae]|nr:Uncharacterised protein [Vibrio cholerae]